MHVAASFTFDFPRRANAFRLAPYDFDRSGAYVSLLPSRVHAKIRGYAYDTRTAPGSYGTRSRVTVVVSCAKVSKPVAVRYAYSMNPDGCNLYNKDGLPASPFRTDQW